MNFFAKIKPFNNLNFKLAPTIPKCQRNDPNISQCIAKAIEELKPHFVTGDFGGGYIVPKLEPMSIKE